MARLRSHFEVADSGSAAARQTFTLSIFACGTPARSGVLSQLATGGWWNTTLTLGNNSSTEVTARMVLHAEDGTALYLPWNVTVQGLAPTVTGNTFDVILAPRSTAVMSSTTQSMSTLVGWAEVLSSGPLDGFAIFSNSPQTGPPSEGTAPLQKQFPSSMTLPYDNTAGFLMGVAIASLSTTSANITATIWDDAGSPLGTQTITIAGSGHTSFALPSALPLTTGRRGIVQFQSSTGGGIAGLGLRFSPTGTFTSVPTIPGQ